MYNGNQFILFSMMLSRCFDGFYDVFISVYRYSVYYIIDYITEEAYS